MTLAEVRRVGEVGLLRYLLGPGGPDHRFLRWAVELSRLCPPSGSAFSVGAVIVGEDGEVLATGFSREQEDHDHAEEVALRKLRSVPWPRPAAAARHHLQLAGALRRARVAPGDLRRAHRRGGHPAGRLRVARAPPVHRRRGRRTAPGRGRGRHRGARAGRAGQGGQRPPSRIRRVTSPELRHCRVAIFGYFFVLGVAVRTGCSPAPRHASLRSPGSRSGCRGLRPASAPAA